MSQNPPILHLLFGKIASGKSTLTAKLSDNPKTVIIAEDDWLSSLYSDKMSTVSDYVRCSAKLRQIMGPHVVSLLKAGVSVIMDFPANTVANRKWMLKIIAAANAAHQLHFLDTPDEVCLEQAASAKQCWRACIFCDGRTIHTNLKTLCRAKC